MNRKSNPFSGLTVAEVDTIVDRAHQERAVAIAAAVNWALRTLWAAIAAILRRGGPAPARGRDPLVS
jgi:hypothetical protein